MVNLTVDQQPIFCINIFSVLQKHLTAIGTGSRIIDDSN